MKKITLLVLLLWATTAFTQVNQETKGDSLVYCMPVFSWDGASNFTIDSVTFSNLIGTKVGSGYDYPAETSMTVTPPAIPESFTVLYKKDTAKVEAGKTYTLAVTRSADDPPPMIRYAWFDWNQNGSFADQGEEYMVSDESSQEMSTTASINITIPTNANGIVRMRVRMIYDGVTNTLAGKSCDSIHFHGGGCGETEDYLVKVSSSSVQINEISKSNEISIYPNPTNGKCFITLDKNTDSRIINVFDITGNQVFNKLYEKSNSQTILDLSSLNNGVYILSVSASNSAISYFKIIKN